MNSNPTARKLIQMSEEAQTPVHVPIIIGNECFIVTQQDVRKTEDVRLLSYCKLMPNGDLIAMEALGHDGNIRDAILNTYKNRMQCDHTPWVGGGGIVIGGNGPNIMTDPKLLAELLARLYGIVPAQPYAGMELIHAGTVMTEAPVPMQQSPPVATVATIQQQLQWARASNNSSAPIPLHCTSATSTSEISPRMRAAAGYCHCCCCAHAKQQTANTKSCCNRACNTMEVDECPTQTDRGLSAREQLKQKKMKQEPDISYIS